MISFHTIIRTAVTCLVSLEIEFGDSELTLPLFSSSLHCTELCDTSGIFTGARALNLKTETTNGMTQ